MRTTVRLDDNLIRKAKQEAQKRGETLTSLIDQGLRLVLARSRVTPNTRRVRLPISTATGGTRPGVDLNNSAALLDLMEGGE